MLNRQFSHFANLTPCEELVLKRHFWQMWNAYCQFRNFGGLKSVLKFHIFLYFERVNKCYGSRVKNWYQILKHVKNGYQMLTHLKNWYQIITYVKNWNLIFTDINDRICNIQSHIKDSIYHMTCGCKRLDDYTSFSVARRQRERGRERERGVRINFKSVCKFVLETASYVDQRETSQKYKY